MVDQPLSLAPDGNQPGSMYTGYTVEVAVSSAWSGLRSIVPELVVTPTAAVWAVSPGPSALEAAGFLVLPMVPVVAESHMIGAGALNTACPAESAAVRLPVESALTDTPVVAVDSAMVASAGLVAAVALCTISDSVKPPCASAETIRSTPGSTEE
jgi:hypothetical protein